MLLLKVEKQKRPYLSINYINFTNYSKTGVDKSINTLLTLKNALL